MRLRQAVENFKREGENKRTIISKGPRKPSRLFAPFVSPWCIRMLFTQPVKVAAKNIKPNSVRFLNLGF